MNFQQRQAVRAFGFPQLLGFQNGLQGNSGHRLHLERLRPITRPTDALIEAQDPIPDYVKSPTLPLEQFIHEACQSHFAKVMVALSAGIAAIWIRDQREPGRYLQQSK